MPTITQGDFERTTRTFTVNGATNVFVPDTRITANSIVHATVKTVGGTVAPLVYPVAPVPNTPGSTPGFTVVSSAGNTSTYNYRLF